MALTTPGPEPTEFSASPASPPVAKRVPSTSERHGRTVVDDWAWLADRDDPDTLAYLEAENAYTDSWFAPHQGLVDDVFAEIKRRTQETDLSVPTLKGAWWYLTRTVEGLAYPIHCRRPVHAEPAPRERWATLPGHGTGKSPNGGEGEADETSTRAGEVTLLDENAEAAGHDYFALGAFDVSPSGRLLAWSSDVDGDEVYTLRVRDLETGGDLADTVERTYYGTAWSADERHLFYVVPDAAMRPFQVWRHELGTAQTDDALVLQEDDERFYVGLELSRSEEIVFVSIDSKTSSETWFLRATDPTAPPTLVEARSPDHEYSVDHQGQKFLILTNDGALDFRVVAASVDAPGRAAWREVVPHRPSQRITSVDAFDGFFVLQEWHDATPRLRIVFDGGQERVPAFEEKVHSVDLSANPVYTTTALRFEYESLVTPRAVFEEDVRGGDRRLLKQTSVLGGFDSADYDAVRTWAVADDGTRVPVDVVHHRSTPLDGSAPAVLYGYGAYEHSMAPWFSIARLSLLDRGVVWALAHPRGGGELGRRWYEEGKLRNKRNSFTDLIAAAEHLGAGLVRPGGVAIRGGSAGGLLVGAAMTMRPDLFAAVVGEVPFVDVVNTMLDPSLPLTVTEWEEWGDPRSPEYEAELSSYTPYENVAAVDYPPLLVTAGLNDPRVSYHEPAKWVAKLRAVSTGDRPLLLKTELSAGHGGPSGRYRAWEEEAKVLAFLLTVLGASAE